MDSKILLSKILQRFHDKKLALGRIKQFEYIKENHNTVFVTREDGEDTSLPFNKIIIAIEA